MSTHNRDAARQIKAYGELLRVGVTFLGHAVLMDVTSDADDPAGTERIG